MAKPKQNNAPAPRRAEQGAQVPPFGGIKGGWVFFVLIVTFFVLSPSLQNKFVNLDDTQYIIENPVVKNLSTENLKLIFSERFVGNYQPITMLTYLMDYKIFGLNPFGFHLVNLIFHLLGTFFVFLIIKKLSGNDQTAFITSLLFGIHPLHVESVTWIAERKDVLYGFFFLWALYLYIQPIPALPEGKEIRTTSPSVREGFRMGLCLLLFLLSLLSKAQAVVLPVVFFAVDFLVNRKFTKKTILEKIPFFVLAVAFGLIAIKVQGKAGAMQTFQYFPFYERILFSCYALMTYLHKLVLPIDLSCFYPYPETDDKINTVWVYLSPAVLLSITFLVWKYFKSSKNENDTKNTKSNTMFLFRIVRTNSFCEDSRVVLFGTTFFLITIILVLQLLPIGDALYADRYTYIPSIGLFFIAAFYFSKHQRGQKLFMFPAAAYLLFLCYLTFQRTKVWHDSITLYTNAIDNGYKAAIIYNNRGAVLSDSSKNEEALKDFTSLVKLKPHYPNGWRNKGLIQVRLGLNEEAIKSFTEEIKYYPADTKNYLSRGTLLVQKNDFEGALKDFSKMIELEPNNGEGYYARSEAFGKSNRLNEALFDINKAIEFSPNNGQAYNNRGIIYSMSGKFQEAVNDFTKSLELKPDNKGAYTNRALAYKGMGKYAEALQDMLTAKEKGVAVDDNMINELKR
ncbi:MAG: tetratricopeptide repeat protein [Bacteroidetes bacterium]|nr:tetratricopeptide repeat protein [Bacteroidota bacterium]